MKPSPDDEKATRRRAMKYYRLKRFERGLAPDDPRHGTGNAYTNWGCRCKPCTLAHAAVNAASRARAAMRRAEAQR